MAITVWCPYPGCGEEFDVRDSARGLAVPCPACHRPIPIGAPDEPPPLPAYVAAPQPLAPPRKTARTRSRTRRRRLGGTRRAFGLRRGASARFGREEPKTRNGCVTAWLVLVIVVNSLGAIGGIMAKQALAGRFPTETSWVFPVATAFGLATVICAVALLNWKLWGFIGICVLTAAGMGLSLYLGEAPLTVAAGVLQPALLFAFLRMGDRKSTWSQLE